MCCATPDPICPPSRPSCSLPIQVAPPRPQHAGDLREHQGPLLEGTCERSPSVFKRNQPEDMSWKMPCKPVNLCGKISENCLGLPQRVALQNTRDMRRNLLSSFSIALRLWHRFASPRVASQRSHVIPGTSGLDALYALPNLWLPTPATVSARPAFSVHP